MKIRNLTLITFVTLFVAACSQNQVVQSDALLGANALDTPHLEEAENPGEQAANPDETPTEEMLSEASVEGGETFEGMDETEEAEVVENIEPTDETVATAEQDSLVSEDLEEVGELVEEGELDQEAVAIVAEVESSTDEMLEAPSFEEPVDSPKVVQFTPSKNPVIRSRALELNGERVNRYYFARPGDSAESLSTLFYGDESRSAELVAINGEPSSWKSGKLLYYSAAQSTDETMQSFYEERNVISEAYTIEKGDTLSQIAEKRFGNLNNWKELAVANELDNPDRILTGSVLFVYPIQMDEYAPKSQVAAIQEETQTPTASLLSETTSTDQQAAVIGRTPTESPFAETKVVNPAAVKQASVGIMGFIEQNLMLLLIGLGLLLSAFVGYLLLGGEKSTEHF